MGGQRGDGRAFCRCSPRLCRGSRLVRGWQPVPAFVGGANAHGRRHAGEVVADAVDGGEHSRAAWGGVGATPGIGSARGSCGIRRGRGSRRASRGSGEVGGVAEPDEALLAAMAGFVASCAGRVGGGGLGSLGDGDAAGCRSGGRSGHHLQVPARAGRGVARDRACVSRFGSVIGRAGAGRGAQVRSTEVAGVARGAVVEQCAGIRGDCAAEEPGRSDQCPSQHVCADY